MPTTTFQSKLLHKWEVLFSSSVKESEYLKIWWPLLLYAEASTVREFHRLPKHPVENIPLIQDAYCKWLEHKRRTGEIGLAHHDHSQMEQILVNDLAQEIRENFPRLAAIFEEKVELNNFLRIRSYLELSLNAKDPRSKKVFLDECAARVPLAFTRIPDNPIRIYYDRETGKMDGKDLHLASSKQFFELKSLQRVFQPQRKPGRPKGLTKATGSGRKAVDRQLCVEAWKAEQAGKKYQSPPWWLIFAREKRIQVPEDHNGKEALRKRIKEWSLKGKMFTHKKIGG
jgi:hypothetical protein